MREPRLQIHPAVEDDDLADIVSYILQDNPVAAKAVNRSIRSMFTVLASQPLLGTDIHPMRRALKGIRMIPVTEYRNYLIYYRPLPKNAGVRILYVLHAARDAVTFAREHRRR
ncbi:MAG TPA: type II toxin-antitoxin system RelE/ParE family toxin [Prosthecobacter sp.]